MSRIGWRLIQHITRPLTSIQAAKEAALVAAGLNSDGSPPSNYGQTTPPTFDVGAYMERRVENGYKHS